MTLTASSSETGLFYQWGNDSIGAVITVSPVSTTIYTVTVKNTSGCIASANVTVTVKQIFPSENTFSVCKGQSVTLKAPEGINYIWSTSDTTESVTVSPTDFKIYYVTFTVSTKMVIDSFMVQMRPNPTVNAGADTTIQVPATQIILIATAGTPTATTKYQWSTGTWSDTIHVAPITTTTYVVTLYDGSGCTASDKVTVFVGSSLVQDTTKYWVKHDSTICLMPGINKIGIGTCSPDERLSVMGNAKFSGDIIFGDNNSVDKISLSYTRPANGNYGALCFGAIPTASITDPCYTPIIDFHSQFSGLIQSCGYNSQHFLNILTMGIKGSDGIIDLAGDNNINYPPRLMINYNCGKDVIVGGQYANQGSFTTLHNTYLATADGNVGIGTINPLQKFQVNGHIAIMGTNSLFLGQGYTIAGNANYGQWGIEYNEGAGGLNFWKPYGSNSGLLNYLLFIKDDGNVGIGTTTIPTGVKLAVCGTIQSEEWIVETGSCDYKLYPDYKRMTWQEKSDYIIKNKHLPEIDAGDTIEKTGLHLGKTAKGMISNIEDNTLDIIELYKENQNLKAKIEELENKLNTFLNK